MGRRSTSCHQTSPTALPSQIRFSSLLQLHSFIKPSRSLFFFLSFSALPSHPKLSAWVATKILDSGDIRVRLATLKFFVAVAQRCMELNNFNSATSIHAALECSAVHRLKKTWEQFNTDKKNKQLVLVYESMCSLFSPKGNYSNYRKHLHTINPPVRSFLSFIFLASSNLFFFY